MLKKLKYLNRLVIDIYKNSERHLNEEKNIAASLEKYNKALREYQTNIADIADMRRDISGILNSVKYINLEYFQVLDNSDDKILLVGFYGARNLGDELMFRKIYEDLCVEKSNIYVLMCDNEDLDVFEYAGINILHYPKTKYDYNFLANCFEYLVFGGGAIIDDTKSRENDSFKFDMGKIFVELSSAFLQKKKPVYSFGLSTSRNITDADYINKLGKIVNKSSFFSVRDKYSAALIRKITGQEIKEINDIVLTYDTPPVEMDKKDGRLVVGIIWICYEDLKDALLDLIRGLISELKDTDYELRLIPFYDYKNCDLSFYLKIKEEFADENISIAKMHGKFEDIYREVNECGLIVSMRYHGALIGLMAGIKTFSYLYKSHQHYYNKMTDLYEKFDCTENLCITVEELKDKAVSAVSEGGICRNTKRKEFDNRLYQEMIKEISGCINR